MAYYQIKKFEVNRRMIKNSIWQTKLPVFLSFLIVIVLISTSQASLIKTGITSQKMSHRVVFPPFPTSTTSSYDDPYYTWKDDFNDETKIDLSPPGAGETQGYIVENSQVSMQDTYSVWTDPAWTRMEPITITNNGNSLTNYALKIVVPYDGDMQTDYDDLRFKFQGEDYWLDYWIEDRNSDPNNPSATVWIKIPSIPNGQSTLFMFYGNSNAEYVGDFQSVFSEWSKEWTHDERVSQHAESEGSWDPDVAFGDSRFFVAWEEGTVLPINQEIRGQIHTADGDIVARDFDIGNPSGAVVHQENPSVAYGGNRFLVAWEKYTIPGSAYSMDIAATLLTTTGDIVKQFSVCTESNCQADPCVAFDSVNNRFCIVWEDARSGSDNYNLFARFYDTSGNHVGSEQIICNDPNSQAEPWIAFDDVNSHFFVVWEEGVEPDTGPFSLYGRLFDAQGTPIGSRLSIASGTTQTDYNFPCVAFCEQTERFLVTWNEDDISDNDWWGNIWGKIYDKNGAVVVDTFKIQNGEFTRTDVVPYLATNFLVAYDGGGEIWGKLIGSDGSIITTSALQLSDDESSPADWVNLASGDERVFVSWEDTRVVYPPPYNGNPDVYANIWNLNIPSGSDVTYSVGGEKKLRLSAAVTSISIEPEGLRTWHEFNAVFTGSVTFSLLDGQGNVLRSDVSSGANLQGISSSSLRLMARFSRNTPASSPMLEKWNVTYVGEDSSPPRTEIQDILGEEGDNGWYVSTVNILLAATDGQKGVGVDEMYYSLNGGDPLQYDDNMGILLPADDEELYGEWNVEYWSVDKAGNVEAPHEVEIKVDKQRPYIEITEPADKAELKGAFWVRTNPSDGGSGIWKVVFDTGTPFNNPVTVSTTPWEWYCDRTSLKGWHYIQAEVYDYAGNTYKDTIQIYFDNRKYDEFDNRWCFVLAVGNGVTTDKTTALSAADVVNRLSFQWINRFDQLQRWSENIEMGDPHATCFVFGEVQWNFSSGLCFSAGLNGVYSLEGSQAGNAKQFFGVVLSDATPNVVIGVAASMHAAAV